MHEEYLDVDPEHPSVFAYTRTLGGERVLVLIHFGRKTLAYELREGIRISGPLLDNGAGTIGAGIAQALLSPWQATVYGCR